MDAAVEKGFQQVVQPGVIPANAGIQGTKLLQSDYWIPAFAGMTRYFASSAAARIALHDRSDKLVAPIYPGLCARAGTHESMRLTGAVLRLTR